MAAVGCIPAAAVFTPEERLFLIRQMGVEDEKTTRIFKGL